MFNTGVHDWTSAIPNAGCITVGRSPVTVYTTSFGGAIYRIHQQIISKWSES